MTSSTARRRGRLGQESFGRLTAIATMFEYKFVTIPLNRGFWLRRPAEDYQAIIHQHARQGWRLVQIFAPPVYGYGKAVAYELIFERPQG